MVDDESANALKHLSPPANVCLERRFAAGSVGADLWKNVQQVRHFTYDGLGGGDGGKDI